MKKKLLKPIAMLSFVFMMMLTVCVTQIPENTTDSEIQSILDDEKTEY